MRYNIAASSSLRGRYLLVATVSFLCVGVNALSSSSFDSQSVSRMSSTAPHRRNKGKSVEPMVTDHKNGFDNQNMHSRKGQGSSLSSFSYLSSWIPGPPAAASHVMMNMVTPSGWKRNNIRTIHTKMSPPPVPRNHHRIGVGRGVVSPTRTTATALSMTATDSIQQENEQLKQKVEELEKENTRLRSIKRQPELIIETFEGEGRRQFDAFGDEINPWYGEKERVADLEEGETNGKKVLEQEQLLSIVEECEIDSDACPLEPDVTFSDALKERAYWLCGLLALQSLSGLILARNEALLQNHPVIIYFLTMLVGAGGNAGNQASVRVIRGLALGTLNEQTQRQFLNREFKMACALSAILTVTGFVRAAVFHTPFPETVAVTMALFVIVFSSICLGAILPLILKWIGVDPAHSSTSIQVVMDILGVLLTVAVSTTILDSTLGKSIIASLSMQS
mmetsp:Transcript_184/g.310  ORF Transcript_184/g.310 Transcript_184/m.310 type:complete len:450 (-) Transcript_184:186-1535(-)